MTNSGALLDGAACKGLPLDTFFGHEERLARDKRAIVGQAREICGGCSVQPQCLAYVMAVEHQGARYGIWAGMTAEDRQRLGRRAQVAA